MLFEDMVGAIGRAHGPALDAVTRTLWAAVAAGQIGDEDAGRLSAAIDARKGSGLRTQFAPQRMQQAAQTANRRERIVSRPRTDISLERSRRWAAAGRMPPALACKFTQGEQAALAVIAVEVTKRNTCSMAIGAIAALAGVSASTVKRAVRQAKALGFLTVQERRLSRYRNETNIVRIISKAWLSWLELRGSRGGVQRCTGTNTSGLREGRGGDRRANFRGSEGSGEGSEAHIRRREMGQQRGCR